MCELKDEPQLAARTRHALEESIAHWKRNVEAETYEDIHIGGAHCALCHAFVFDAPDEETCLGCPVYLRTGQKDCMGSPYLRAYIARILFDLPGGREAWREAARAELTFLESLREDDP